MTTKELFKCAEYCLTSNNCEDCPKGSKEECPFKCAISTHTLYNILKKAVAEIEAVEKKNDEKSLPKCPFCGSEDVGVRNLLKADPALKNAGITEDNWNVLCNNCYAAGGTRRTREKAIAAWRMRNND